MKKQAKVVGSMPAKKEKAGSLKRTAVARPRKEPDLTNPKGQFGAFLRWWLDKHHAGDEKPLATSLEVSERTIRKWCEGSAAPDLAKLDNVATAMGFDDWSKLAVAVVKRTVG